MKCQEVSSLSQSRIRPLRKAAVYCMHGGCQPTSLGSSLVAWEEAIYKGIEFRMVYWCLVCNWLAIQPIGVDCIRGLCTCRLVHMVRSTSTQLTTDTCTCSYGIQSSSKATKCSPTKLNVLEAMHFSNCYQQETMQKPH